MPSAKGDTGKGQVASVLIWGKKVLFKVLQPQEIPVFSFHRPGLALLKFPCLLV